MNHLVHARVRRYMLAALGCFVLSLVLPAIDLDVGSDRAYTVGLFAWMYALQGGPIGFFSLGNDSQTSMLLLPFFAAVLNLNFLAAAIWRYRARLSRPIPPALVVAAAAGVLFAVLSPLPVFDDTSLLPGFYVWLVAHCLLLYATVLGAKEDTNGAGEA